MCILLGDGTESLFYRKKKWKTWKKRDLVILSLNVDGVLKGVLLRVNF